MRIVYGAIHRIVIFLNFLKGLWSEIEKLLFCDCHCAFNSPLFRCIKIFYLNLIKAIKFALKVIDMNRPAPNLQLGLGNKIWRRSCIVSLPSAVIAKKLKQNIVKMSTWTFYLISCHCLCLEKKESIVGYNFLRHNSFPIQIVSWALVCSYWSL